MPKYSGFDPIESHNVVTTSTSTGRTDHTGFTDDTVLYLPFDSDTNDDSPNGYTVTASGGATISSAQSKFGGNSGYFDGSDDILRVPSTVGNTYLTTDFTIEMWIYPTTLRNARLWSVWGSNSSNRNLLIQTQSAGNVQVVTGDTNNNSVTTTSSGGLTVNTWAHIAVVRISDTVTLYIDGVNKGSHTIGSGALHQYYSNVGIGGRGDDPAGAAFFEGYIDDLRVVKNKGIYTGNFTPPTSALGLYKRDPVSLYLPFDSDVNDDSDHAHTVTAYGNAAISSTQAKFGGNSLGLDGTGDYLTIPSNDAFHYGDGDFTIEMWVYMNTNSGGSSPMNLISKWDDGQRSWAFELESGNKPRIRFSYNGSTKNVDNTLNADSALTSGQWHHLAFVRSGATLTTYLDGIAGSTTINLGTNSLASPTSSVYIGQRDSQRYFNGYIDDLRIIKGVARYTKNFIPPSQAVGATLNGTNETNTTTDFTSLYLPFDSDVNDDSSHSHSVTTYGNAAISSTQAKFGSNSLSLDGTGDYLQIADDASLEFGDGDLTIEAWLYQNDATGHVIACKRNSGGTWSSGAWIFGVNTNIAGSNDDAGKVQFWAYDYNTGAFLLDFGNGSAFSSGWHHFAVTRAGDKWSLFVDGTQVDTRSWTGSIANASHPVFIGRDSFGGGRYETNGYIDDFRILKGYAKYTADFVPPTSAVGTSVSETVNDLAVLYMPFDDDSFEDQARNHSVMRIKNGDVALNTSVKKFGTSSAYFDGTDNLALPADDFSFGDNDFTIEAWVYLTSYDGQGSTIISRWNGNETNGKGWLLYILGGGQLNFTYSTDGSSNVSTTASGGNLSLNTWTHVAFTRQGDVGRFFINGTVDSTTRNFSGSSIYNPPTSSVDVMIGAREGGVVSKLSGYIDDLRVIKGKAKYTASFTAPTSAVGTELSETTTTVTTDTKTLSSTWTMTDDGSSPRSFIDMRSDNTWANNEHLQSSPDHRWNNPPGTPGTTATGGSIATPGNGYRYHVFTSPGTFELSAIDGGSPSLAVEYLVVAGGGGGGADRAGGGGAGGLRTNEDGNPKAGAAMNIATGSFPVVVGTGGAGGVWPSPTTSDQGGTSSFNGISAAGGGTANIGAGGDGGSGGGGGTNSTPSGSGNTPPTSPPQGNPGGTGHYPQGGGGGGGAGAAGSAGNPNAGAGGAGHAMPSFAGPILSPVIPGSMSTAIGPTGLYAGGGGGGGSGAGPNIAGAGGPGGGGAGGNANVSPGSYNPNSGEYGPAGAPAVDGTGGGGGGAGNFPGTNPNMRPGGDGGNGVVIIKYAY